MKSFEARRDRVEFRAETEACIPTEATATAGAPLARIDVEELSGNTDHALLQRPSEEAHAVVERRRQRRQVAPAIERAVRLRVEAHAEFQQAVHHDAPLAREG